jgi:hypothetical protein
MLVAVLAPVAYISDRSPGDVVGVEGTLTISVGRGVIVPAPGDLVGSR